ncbi:MAG: HAMP domain-containing protein [Sandaracinaceae bacterium]|nr:HAMP domain-containing protein [Sandaracinaceae bacterium]
MNRLFVRLFLSVWLASALIGAAIALVEAGWRAPASEAAEDRVARRLIEVEATALLELDGPAREARLDALREATGMQLVVFDASDRVVIGDAPSDAMTHLARRAREEPDATERAYDASLVAARLLDGSIAVARRPARPTWARALGTETFALRAVIVLLVSGGIAFAFARYLSRPLDRLRAATEVVADGDLSARVTPSLGGAPEEVTALARDFDRMVARVEALVASRDRLLSDVSHELGSPLARLRVALELARGKADVAAGPMLDRIEREAEQLGSLVDEILTLRRLETDGPLAREDVDLVELVGDIARDAAFEASESEVSFALDLPEALSTRGDRELLRRAIENVMRNAIHHAPGGTEVEVALTRDADGARLVIRDHGPGVPVEDRERIFEPLVRLDAARDRQSGGRGLGLAIAKRAAEAHGGAIGADEGPGGGLSVTLRLPLHASSHDLT